MMDDEETVLGRFMHIMDQYERAERGGDTMSDIFIEGMHHIHDHIFI